MSFLSNSNIFDFLLTQIHHFINVIIFISFYTVYTINIFHVPARTILFQFTITICAVKRNSTYTPHNATQTGQFSLECFFLFSKCGRIRTKRIGFGQKGLDPDKKVLIRTKRIGSWQKGLVPDKKGLDPDKKDWIRTKKDWIRTKKDWIRTKRIGSGQKGFDPDKKGLDPDKKDWIRSTLPVQTNRIGSGTTGLDPDKNDYIRTKMTRPVFNPVLKISYTVGLHK